jgi:methyl-accepting chemotaxis protein
MKSLISGWKKPSPVQTQANASGNVSGKALEPFGSDANRNTSNRHFLALLSNFAFLEMDREGKILDANDRFLQLLGFSKEEVIGKKQRELLLLNRSAQSAYQEMWNGLQRGESRSGTVQVKAHSGENVWFRAMNTPVHSDSGSVTRVIWLATEASAEIREEIVENGKLDAISRSMAVIEFETDGTIITANQNFLSTVGYQLSEIQGQHHRMFVAMDEAGSADYREFWNKLRRGEFVAGEFKRFGRGGKEIWIQASYNPIYDDLGNVCRVVKFASDITHQMQMRNDVRDVGHAVASGTSQLTSAATEISRSVSHTAGLAQTAERLAAKTSDSVNHLNESSKLIERVVTVINELADQTNLLALNATIESARAGEAGRSFAVVASEVKQLAGQTAEATKNIEATVRDIQASVACVVDSTNGITQSVADVNQNMSTIAAAVEEQSVTMADLSQRAARLM